MTESDTTTMTISDVLERIIHTMAAAFLDAAGPYHAEG